MRKHFLVVSVCLALTAGWSPVLAAAESNQPDNSGYEQMVNRAVAFLATKGQAEDGSFSSQAGPAVTALVATALMRHGRTPSDPVISKSLAYLEQFVQANGGIHATGSLYANYETSIAILCLTEANKDGRHTERLKKADAFLKGLQWDEGEEQDASDAAYGGAGYGKSKRPDLSNTQFFMDALKAMGADKDDEAVKRALIFVSRCQNLETEHNTTPFSAKNSRRRFLLHPRGGRIEHGRSHAGGRVAKLWLDDLRGPEEHDLRRPEGGRSAGQSRRQMDQHALRPEFRTRGWGPPACTTTTTPLPKPSTP